MCWSRRTRYMVCRYSRVSPERRWATAGSSLAVARLITACAACVSCIVEEQLGSWAARCGLWQRPDATAKLARVGRFWTPHAWRGLARPCPERVSPGGIRGVHQPVTRLSTRGSVSECVELRSYRGCCLRTQQGTRIALARAPPALAVLPISTTGGTAQQVLQHMFPVPHGRWRWTAEATEEAEIDGSGPTMLGGGHHQKEADFARVRSEVTEGVPPRRSWQLRHRHGNGNGY